MNLAWSLLYMVVATVLLVELVRHDPPNPAIIVGAIICVLAEAGVSRAAEYRKDPNRKFKWL